MISFAFVKNTCILPISKRSTASSNLQTARNICENKLKESKTNTNDEEPEEETKEEKQARLAPTLLEIEKEIKLCDVLEEVQNKDLQLICWEDQRKDEKKKPTKGVLAEKQKRTHYEGDALKIKS